MIKDKLIRIKLSRLKPEETYIHELFSNMYIDAYDERYGMFKSFGKDVIFYRNEKEILFFIYNGNCIKFPYSKLKNVWTNKLHKEYGIDKDDHKYIIRKILPMFIDINVFELYADYTAFRLHQDYD